MARGRAVIGQRILVLAPHPDDEVVGCCAAIGRARRAGSRVAVFFLTDGVPPADALWPWQRNGRGAWAARRREESERAAERLGIAVAGWQDIPGRRLKSHIAATRARLRGLIASERTDCLWAPAYEGGHQDHDVANFIASTVVREIPVWEFSEYNFRGGRVRSQEFPAARGDERALTLDPAEQAEKTRLLALYRSERRNLGYVRVEREIFRPLAAYDYAKPPHSGRPFYGRFWWAAWHPRVDGTRPEDVSRALCAARLDGTASGTP